MGQKHRHRHRHHHKHHGGGGGGGPQHGNQQGGGGNQQQQGGGQQDYNRQDQGGGGGQRGPRYRVIIDLDEALGIPLTNGVTIVGFQKRPGLDALLDKLCRRHVLLLWSAGSKRYVDKILGFGLRRFFREIYSADDLPATWKDPRKLKADYVIDVVEEHRDAAKSFNLEDRFIIIPAYGSIEDERDPLGWAKQIETILLPPLPAPPPQAQPQQNSAGQGFAPPPPQQPAQPQIQVSAPPAPAPAEESAPVAAAPATTSEQ